MSKDKLILNEQRVLDYLSHCHSLISNSYAWVSPTQIGHDLRGHTKNGLPVHSSWASPICKRLVKKGLIKRNKKGWYRFYQYQPNEYTDEDLKIKFGIED